jgi:two-component SAPR family response regulator
MSESAALKVFVVEDETIVAMLLEQMLEELDCEVAGVAGQLNLAMDLARSVDAEVAILDLNLSGQRVDPVAQILADRQMPFIFASGYGEDGLAPEWRGRPVLPKPFRLDQLKDALDAATGR